MDQGGIEDTESLTQILERPNISFWVDISRAMGILQGRKKPGCGAKISQIIDTLGNEFSPYALSYGVAPRSRRCCAVPGPLEARRALALVLVVPASARVTIRQGDEAAGTESNPADRRAFVNNNEQRSNRDRGTNHTPINFKFTIVTSLEYVLSAQPTRPGQSIPQDAPKSVCHMQIWRAISFGGFGED